jgi:hypothetical protein
MKLADAKWEGSRFHKNRLIDSIPGMMRTEIGEEARCLAEERMALDFAWLSMTGALAMGLSSAPDSQYLRGEVFERHKRHQEPQTPELEHRAGPPIGRHWGD